MDIICYRDAEYAREARSLPAETYNLAHLLLVKSGSNHLFVPIRSMQYLAILDTEEFVFLDGERKCWIEVAWQHFRPQSRNSLQDPVPYQAVYYQPDSEFLMSRLQAEFPRALRIMAAREHPDNPGKVLKFPGSDHPDRG